MWFARSIFRRARGYYRLYLERRLRKSQLWRDAERELVQSRQNLEFALQAGRMGTWDIDLATQSLSCSKEMLELWNVRPDEFTGDRSILQKKVHPDDVKGMRSAIDLAIRTGGIYEMEFRIRPDADTERWVLSRGRCLLDSQRQKAVRFSGVVYDTTQTRRIQEELRESKEIAEKANMAKTQFLANMSHEIRTPVGAIVGFSEMLRSSANSPAEQLRFMKIIERNSQNLLRLIDDILDVSKIESGKITIEKSEFSLSDFLSEFSSVMSLKAAEKGLHFQMAVEGALPSRIVTDQLRLRQILSNLVGNAIKFTDAGQVELKLRYESSMLGFSIRDTGIGIASEKIPDLFQIFGQIDQSMTRKHGGAGLGLVLSKRISAALGGDVTLAKSEVGVGSVFEGMIEVEVPSAPRERGNETEEYFGTKRQLPCFEAGELKGLTVLVVEDSLDNQALITTCLRQAGALVAIADDGFSGVKRAMELMPDVVLMDIQMPLMDGHQAARELRSVGFSKPIVALTAHAMYEERERCIESGCSEYLTKPVQMEQLVELLARYAHSPELQRFDEKERLTAK